MSALTADKATLQQELSSSRDKVMLLESELKLRTSRMEAAQQQLASEGQEHQAKQALLHKQLEQLQVRGAWPACCSCSRQWNCRGATQGANAAAGAAEGGRLGSGGGVGSGASNAWTEGRI